MSNGKGGRRNSSSKRGSIAISQDSHKEGVTVEGKAGSMVVSIDGVNHMRVRQHTPDPTQHGISPGPLSMTPTPLQNLSLKTPIEQQANTP